MIANCGTLLEFNTGEIEIEIPLLAKKLPQETLDDWDKYGYHWGSKLDRAI